MVNEVTCDFCGEVIWAGDQIIRHANGQRSHRCCVVSKRTAVLETALHREMRDPDYLRSLDQYVDERRSA